MFDLYIIGATIIAIAGCFLLAPGVLASRTELRPRRLAAICRRPQWSVLTRIAT